MCIGCECLGSPHEDLTIVSNNLNNDDEDVVALDLLFVIVINNLNDHDVLLLYLIRDIPLVSNNLNNDDEDVVILNVPLVASNLNNDDADVVALDLPFVANLNNFEVGPHNIHNVRGRNRRRPLTNPLSSRSQSWAHESKARMGAFRKSEKKKKKSILNVANNDGLKKAHKPQ
ncbi:hypothetical protein IGI04_026796, partial [Brassica rapa subsp. trilocularis]